MSTGPTPYNYQDLMLAPAPAVSQDLWLETTDGKARKALRAVSDDVRVFITPKSL
jgi:predicted outer membrane lipoprotein